MTDIAAEKRQLRRAMREKRRSLSVAAQRRHASSLRAHLQYQTWFRSSRLIGAYWATDGEISVRPLMALCWALGKSVYLPVVVPRGRMVFRCFEPGDALRKNRLGIAEPLSRAADIPIEKLDALLVPMVAFCRNGTRLGMGGGYYDRALAGLSGIPGRLRIGPRAFGVAPDAWTKRGPVVVGIAHSCQETTALPHDVRDAPMHMVFTENGRVRFCSV